MFTNSLSLKAGGSSRTLTTEGFVAVAAEGSDGTQAEGFVTVAAGASVTSDADEPQMLQHPHDELDVYSKTLLQGMADTDRVTANRNTSCFIGNSSRPKTNSTYGLRANTPQLSLTYKEVVVCVRK